MRLKRLDFVYYWISSSSYNDSNDSLCSFVSWIFLILLQFESSWYFCLPFFLSLLVFFGNFRISDVGNFDFFFRCDGRKEKIYIYRERERKESEEMAPTRRRWRDRLPPVFSTTYIIDIRLSSSSMLTTAVSLNWHHLHQSTCAVVQKIPHHG